ncbi:MAG: hypothetical protein MJE66_19460 [Proteobacteria bacterium]|nr:hypothetical protein [Pseudomonadota bacterium]
MAIEVVPYTEAWTDAVRAFNRRMEEGGVHWRWYESPVDAWVPKEGDQRTWREHHLAIEDGEWVRGAFALKPHEFRCRGEDRTVTDWQGPITEGILSRRYNTLGLRLIRDMLKKYPLLYSWGHGGLEQPMLEMLRRLGWQLHGTPFCLAVVRPFRFLRQNAYLRGTPARRFALDLLAFSGLGGLGLKLLHAALRVRGGGAPAAEAEPFSEFGSWADELWESCRDEYALIAYRDAATMNLLLKDGHWPPAIKLRVRRDGHTLGWVAVLDTPMEGDVRFGDCRVGSVIDALARPEDAGSVVAAAVQFLKQRGVDLIFSNQAHPAWVAAFAAQGFVNLPDRRIFAASPELTKALEPFEKAGGGLHLTNMDGHGPMRM